jgi:fimbrial chaperone protein
MGATSVHYRLICAAVLGFCLVSVAPSSAWALRLIPFIAEFTPNGPGANQTFRLENETDQPIAVQVSMVHRQVDIDGKETLPEADDDFVVFPPQLVLAPRESRTVRVQWIGNPKPDRELPYRIIAEQLPVELEQNTGGGRVRLLVRYEGSIYVVPSNVAPKPEIKSVERVKRPDGSAGMAVSVQNSGSAHALLNNLQLTLTGADGKAVQLDTAQLEGMAGENVLPGATRKFVLAWPPGLKPDAAVKASISFDQKP